MAEGYVFGEIVDAEGGFMICDVGGALDEVMDDAGLAHGGIAK